MDGAFSSDLDAPGMQLIGRLSNLHLCPRSPCDRLDLPVVREALGDSVTLFGKMPINDGFVMIGAFDYLMNGRRWILI